MTQRCEFSWACFVPIDWEHALAKTLCADAPTPSPPYTVGVPSMDRQVVAPIAFDTAPLSPARVSAHHTFKKTSIRMRIMSFNAGIKIHGIFVPPSYHPCYVNYSSHFSSTNRLVRYSPYNFFSFVLSTRKVSPGKSSP